MCKRSGKTESKTFDEGEKKLMQYTKKELEDLQNKRMIVYKIVNLVNDKVYIGQTVNTFNRRYGGRGIGVQRVIRSQSTNWHLLRAIAKYGVDNFKVEIIEQCNTIEELNEKESYYIELYDSNNDEKGYNKVGGGDNSYWNWKTVLRTYIINGVKFEQQIRDIQRLSRKTGINYKTIMRDLYKEYIFAVSKRTGEVIMSPNILTFCFRDKDGLPNKSSKTAGRCNPSPTDILVMCKQSCGDEKYLPLKEKHNQTYNFFFCKDSPQIMETYLKQLDKKDEEKKKKKEEERKKRKTKRMHTCQSCGKEYAIVSKYCADCKKKIHEEKLRQEKPVKTCPHCGKEHTRAHDTCSTQCTNKLRKLRKK